MLEDVYNSYRTLADEINWKEYDQNELFFNYLRYKDSDPDLAERFYSAIICRYWGYTGRLYLKCNKNVSFEECYDVLIDTINYLLEKQVWNNSESSLYNDLKAPEKAFHFVIKRQLGILLAKKNADKRRAEFKALSIDDIREKYNDASEGLFNLVPNSELSPNMYDYIYTQKDVFTKLVLDFICFSSSNSLNTIARFLKDLTEDDYYDYDIYDLDMSEYIMAIEYIRCLSLKDLVKEIKKILYTIRPDWEN